MLDFLPGDVEYQLRWAETKFFTVPAVARSDRTQLARSAEEASRQLAADSMRRVAEEMQRAASVLVANGFVEPPGRELVADEPVAIVNWNRAYGEAAKQWIEGDPTWERIGGAARFAAQLFNAGAAIQLAALPFRENLVPITSAVTLHNMSVVFGAARVHLDEWLSGAPQKLASQRARAAKLKEAYWLNSRAEQIIRDGLAAGDKVEAIVSDVLDHLATYYALLGPDLPSRDAVRVKIQRIRRSRKP